MIPKFWYRWLLADTIGLMVFGMSMVLVPGVTKLLFSMLIYFDGNFIGSSFSPGANDYIELVHGVLGAVLFGWGLQMFLIIKGPFLKAKPLGWYLIVIPLTAWFIVDTAFSLLTGFWPNAVLNVMLIVIFAIPLSATHKYFKRRG